MEERSIPHSPGQNDRLDPRDARHFLLMDFLLSAFGKCGILVLDPETGGNCHEPIPYRKRLQAPCHRRHDGGPCGVASVSGVFPGAPCAADAYHRQAHLPHYVLLHR